MKKLLLLLAVLSISVASAAQIPCSVTPNAPPVFVADPPVPAGSSPVVVTCNAFGTNVIFDQFDVNPATPGAPSQFTLQNAFFDDVAATVYLQFNPSLSNGQDSYLYFRVRTANGAAILNGVDMTVSGTNAAITEVVCTEAINPNFNVCNPGGVNAQPNSQTLANYAVASGGFGQVSFAPQSQIYIYKNVLTSNPPPTSELSSFTQSFHIVPEPATFALLGGGLLAFALYRRRRA